MNTEAVVDAETTDLSPLQDESHGTTRRPLAGLNLFWRTFFLLAVLLVGSILAWLQTLRSLEFQPRAAQAAQQLASQVNLSRAALIHADAIARVSLLKTMADEEGLQVIPRESSDKVELATRDALLRDISDELQRRMGAQTVLATSVNGRNGLWVAFDIDSDPYWLLTDLQRFTPGGGKTWMIWLMVAALLSLLGAALIARLINRPLKELSFAASRVREGDFNSSLLDESVQTDEIRQVNIGFNRMAQKLAQMDQDRAVMLAGISHDLRTPLARLRLDTEMSVADPQARDYMAADIAQLDAIIDKFLDYARPDKVGLTPVLLSDVIQRCIQPLRGLPDVQIHVQMDPALQVMADAVELGRVVTNLLENARKYGKSVDLGIARVEIAAIAKDKWVLLKIRDHGIGVSKNQLSNLTLPFYRGEAARTAANGAGLGLAIVDKTVQRMGGAFMLNNSSTGGLSANIRLRRFIPD